MKTKKITLRPQLKAGALTMNHSQIRPFVSTKVKAGALTINHTQTPPGKN